MQDVKTYETNYVPDPAQPMCSVRSFGAGLALGLVAGVVFGIGLGWMTVSSRPPTAQAVVAQTNEVAPQPTPMLDVAVSQTLSGVRSYARMGIENAPVQIVMFEDPQCPFCKATATGVLPQVIERYVKTGKASVTYRHFTFLGPESTLLAAAMECAGQQGQFWPMHGQAYQNQQSENSGAATTDLMMTWAKTAGVADADKFKVCLSSPEVRQAIDADRKLGGEIGVRGTPTIFVNGKPLVGAVPYDFVANAIEAQLAVASKP